MILRLQKGVGVRTVFVRLRGARLSSINTLWRPHSDIQAGSGFRQAAADIAELFIDNGSKAKRLTRTKEMAEKQPTQRHNLRMETLYVNFSEKDYEGDIATLVRRKVAKVLRLQGMGKHSEPEMMRIAQAGIDAIAAQIGDKSWLMGAEPCGADAMVFGTVTSLLSDHFVSPLLDATRRHANLVAYRARGMKRWFPEMAG